MKEVCIVAAVVDSNGKIWRGQRHADAIFTMTEAGSNFDFNRSESSQGFVTSRNRFVTREEGYQLQIEAGILSVAQGGYRGNRLFSEDLY